MLVSYDNNHIILNAPDNINRQRNCNIIFVIDISGSMDIIASPVNENGESDDLSRLNLACHSINTIIQSLEENDEVGIISFNNCAYTKLIMTKMNDNGKTLAKMVIDNLQAAGSTNIYDGLKKAFEMLETVKNDNNNSIVLLTDGIANINPENGILNTLISNYDVTKMKPFSLNTFGFSYDINSELLKEIADNYNGIFGFIPECSMVGTVFVNFLANLLITHLINIKLEITYADNTIETINTGAILYGSSRDFILETDKHIKSFDLYYKNNKIDYTLVPYVYNDDNYVNNKTRLSIIKIIKEYYLVNNIYKDNDEIVKILDNYYDSINKTYGTTNIFVKNYIKDYIDPDVVYNNYGVNNNSAQIKLAISKKDYYNKWGKHYLTSLMYGYERQLCINFKDYGIQNFLTPTFETTRNKIENIFCNIPPPTPKVIRKTTTRINSMENYYRTDSVCFDGEGTVYMADNTSKLVKELKKDDEILTMNNKTAKIVCIIKQKIYSNADICHVNGMYITPYHPIFIYNKWSFPKDHFKIETKLISILYNIVLDSNHTILINFIPVITLGHDFKYNNVTKHEYFGSNKVIDDLKEFDGYNEGLIECNKMVGLRDPDTNNIVKLNIY
jgi:hypothetical protein